jgi:hypothetical protein
MDPVSDPLLPQAASSSAAPSAGIILIVIEVPTLNATCVNRRAAAANLQAKPGDLAAKFGRAMTKPRVFDVDSQETSEPRQAEDKLPWHCARLAADAMALTPPRVESTRRRRGHRPR